MNDYSDRRPYAATANVLAVLERIRTRNLPDKLDNDFLRIAGIGPAVFGRVRDALLFLGLVDEDDAPTDVLKAMARAPEAEYRQLLETAIRTAYRADLDVVSPAQDTQAQIIDAFRKYEPRSQTNRMVMLLLGLCHAAGMEVLDAPRERKMSAPAGPRRQTSKTPRGAMAPRGKSSRSNEHQDPATPSTPGMLFGVTESDISALEDDEFDVVWKALGTVARARARQKQQASSPVAETDDLDEFEDGVDA